MVACAALFFAVCVKNDVAGIGEEADGLAKDENRVGAETAVADDDGAANETDNPESDRQNGLVAAVAVVPLVNEPESKYYLACGAPNKEGQGNAVIVEEVFDEGLGIAEHHSDGQKGQGADEGAEGEREFVPYSFDVKIPDIDVVGDYLSEDDGEVIAHPSIEKKQDAADKAENPIEVGGDNFLCPF